MIEPKAARPRACDQARVIQVIETQAIRGLGVSEDDPVRRVSQYWDFDGLLLAEKDPCQEVGEE